MLGQPWPRRPGCSVLSAIEFIWCFALSTFLTVDTGMAFFSLILVGSFKYRRESRLMAVGGGRHRDRPQQSFIVEIEPTL